MVDSNVHVVEVTKAREIDIEPNGIKRGCGKGKEKEGVTSQSDHKQSKKVNETKKAKETQRCINLQDFPLKHGMASYNLMEDMRGKGPDISWPQFLASCPQL